MMTKTITKISSRFAFKSARKRIGRLPVLLLCLLLTSMQSAQASVTLRIEPNEPDVSSCLAFGAGPGAGREGIDAGAPGFPGTSPFMGFVYRNIPPFELAPGDLLSFDLGAENDFDVEIDIAIAATTENGSLTEAEPFTKIVSNSQTPVNPRGDDIIGNYEMEFTVEAPYSFPGGGLILQFSNGSDAYREDLTCNDSQVGVVANESDSAGFFANAFWSDRDGLAPFEPYASGLRAEIIGGFQITEPDEPDRIMLSNDLGDDEGGQAFDLLPGDTVYYRVTIRNPQITDAGGIEVVLTPSDRVELMPGVAPDTVKALIEPGGSEVEVPFIGGAITWTPGSLVSGESQSIIVEMLVSAGNPDLKLVNSAMISAVDAPFVGGNDVILETSFARLALTGKVGGEFGNQLNDLSPGDTAHYRVDVENPYATDADGIEVVTTLSDAVTFVEASTTPQDIPFSGPDIDGNMIWTVGGVAAGDYAQIDIVFELPDPTTDLYITNSATVSAVDSPFVAGNDTIAETPIKRVPAIDFIAVDMDGEETTNVTAGTELNYQVTLMNEDALDIAGLEVSLDLSDMLDFVDSSETLIQDDDDPSIYAWTVGDLAGGAEAILEVTAYVPIRTEPDSILTSVTVISAVDYPFSAADAISWGVRVEENPAPRIITLNSMALNEAGEETTSAVAGRDLAYRVTLDNPEVLDAAGIEVGFNLPDELAVIGFSATPAAAVTPDSTDPTLLIWSVGDLDAGGMAVLDVQTNVPVTVDTGLILRTQAEVTDVDEPVLMDEASVTVTEVEIAGLAQDLLDNAGSSNCFIATAAYGSFLEPEVVVLRRFRDRALLTNEYGRRFVDWYYHVSPPVADVIARHDALRSLVRGFIGPLIYAIKFPGMALALLAFALLAALRYGRRLRGRPQPGVL